MSSPSPSYTRRGKQKKKKNLDGEDIHSKVCLTPLMAKSSTQHPFSSTGLYHACLSRLHATFENIRKKTFLPVSSSSFASVAIELLSCQEISPLLFFYLFPILPWLSSRNSSNFLLSFFSISDSCRRRFLFSLSPLSIST